MIAPAKVATTRPVNPDSAPTRRATISRGMSSVENTPIRQPAAILGRMSRKMCTSPRKTPAKRSQPSRR
jgi:hypothetical protein